MMYTAHMADRRLTVMETKLDAVIPTLATKEDVHKLESAFVKWGVGLALAIVGLVIGYLSLTRAAPAPAPIVIQLPAVTSAQPPAPRVPAPQTTPNSVR